MKWKIRLAFLLFLLCQNLLSQFYWQKTYNSYIGGDDEGYDGCAADGSNFYVVGYTGIFDYYMYVAKFNQLGDTLWTRTFFGGIADAVAPSNDGGCVLTGQRNSCFSMKLDLNGNIVWDKSYPNGAETRDITKTGDSGYVMCGGFFSGYVCKLDNSGNMQWERYYSDSPQDFHTISIAIDGGYIVGGRKFVNNIWKAYLAKMDGYGNIIWEAFYDSPYLLESIAKKNNGYILLVGVNINNKSRTTLVSTDLNGNVKKIDTIISNTVSDNRPSIITINDNRFAISYYAQTLPPQRYVGKVLMIDSSLKILKGITLTFDTNSLYLNNLIEAPGSDIDDFICIGSAEPRGPYELDLYAVRIDSSLTQPPPISMNLISSQVPQKSELSHNYPNPFNGSTIIKFGIYESSFVKLKIFDMLGKEIEVLVSEFLSAGIYSSFFNPKNLSSGIYFYQLNIDGKVVSTHKMIYIK